jgi:hypothetical protein
MESFLKLAELYCVKKNPKMRVSRKKVANPAKIHPLQPAEGGKCGVMQCIFSGYFHNASGGGRLRIALCKCLL